MTRIVAGELGGRRLRVPGGRRTRPTSERVREGLFSTLEAIRGPLTGASFLDLYAGSGAVGLEAASRGAATVLLVERDEKAVAAIRHNVDALGAERVTVRATAVERILGAGASDAFDVVFVDPPYSDPVEPVLELLAGGAWMAARGVVVVERDSRGAPPSWPTEMSLDRTRRYGDTTLWYGRRP